MSHFAHGLAGDAAPRLNPYLALLSGVAAVSTGAIFARLADASPLVIAAYRVGLAVLLMTPLIVWKAGREIRSLSRGDLLTAVFSGFFLALHFAAWISSLSYTAIANSVVLVNTNPLWVGLLTRLVTRERIAPATAGGIVLSFLGACIIGAGDFAAGEGALLGDALALAGGICAAFYLMLGRRLRRNLSLLGYVGICYGSAAIILWSLVFALGLPAVGFSVKTRAALWSMALIPQLIGHTSYNWALRWFGTSLIAVSLLGEPIGAAVLGYWVFGERLTWGSLCGGVLILAAVVMTAGAEGRRGR